MKDTELRVCGVPVYADDTMGVDAIKMITFTPDQVRAIKAMWMQHNPFYELMKQGRLHTRFARAFPEPYASVQSGDGAPIGHSGTS